MLEIKPEFLRIPMRKNKAMKIKMLSFFNHQNKKGFQLNEQPLSINQ